MVVFHEIDKNPTAFFLHLYKEKNSQRNERKATLDYGKRQSQQVNQYPGLSQFVDPESFE